MSYNPNAIGSKLALSGSTSGAISQFASATTASYSITWPAAQGGVGYVLTNDGLGNLSWAPASGGVSVSSLNSLTGSLNIVAGSGITVTPGGSSITIASTGGGGSVTSVGLSLPSIFTVTVSPITSSGSLTAVLASQSANTFFAAPDGSSGAPTFRAIVAADVPTLNQSTTGTASNITASSNSTLTTLSSLTTASSLSVSGSQISGGTLGSVNGSAITNLSAANLSGVIPVGVTGGSGLSVGSFSGSLVGDVTGTQGATVISADAVTLAKMANLAANSVIGNNTGSPATPIALTLASAATASSVVYRDTNANTFANNWVQGFTSTAQPASITLSVASTQTQFITGSGPGVIKLPVGTTLTVGHTFKIYNQSTSSLNLNYNDNSATPLGVMSKGTIVIATITDNTTAHGTWEFEYTVDFLNQTNQALPITFGGTGAGSVVSAFNALSPTSVKGDIIVATTTSNVRQAVGTDGQVLTADSTQTTGVKWATVPSSISTIGIFDSQTASANGLVISGTSLYAQSASVTNPGMVNTTTQSFGGSKTFTLGLKSVGSTDVTQLLVKGNSTQTNFLMDLQDSSGVSQFSVDSGGATLINGAVVVPSNHSITAGFFKGFAANTASTGIFNVANNLLGIAWRNAANTADIGIKLDASNIFQFNSSIRGQAAISAAGHIISTGVGPANDATDGMKILYQTGTGWLASGVSDGISFGNGNLTAGGIPSNTLATLSSAGAFAATGTISASNFSGSSSGVNTGDQTNISGNAATVTTNANLTGVVTSIGNVTTIPNGNITNAMLATSYNVNLFTLSSGDISNGFVTLSSPPNVPVDTILTVIGGPMQSYGDDYTVSGSVLTWVGNLAIGGNSALVSGDKLVVQYN